MNNYAFVEGKKIKSAKFYWDLRFSLKNGTKPEKIKKTLFLDYLSINIADFLKNFKLLPICRTDINLLKVVILRI